jgi:hypothetical protein
MQAWHTREICYFLVNSTAKKHVDRTKIMTLPSEQEKIGALKRYETKYAERMLKRMAETTQNK